METKNPIDAQLGFVTGKPDKKIIIFTADGDECIMDDETPGTCKTLRSCPPVLQTFWFKTPVVCAFTPNEVIICCPDEKRPKQIKVSQKITGLKGKKKKEPPDFIKNTKSYQSES